MSRFTGLRNGAPVMICGACGVEQGVKSAERVSAEQGAAPLLRVTCPCGAVSFVPFNNWQGGDRIPEVDSELANRLHYEHGNAQPNAGVQLVELEGEQGLGIAGDLVPEVVQLLTEKMAKRDDHNKMIEVDRPVVKRP